jgi:large subunit ribosomal protein L13e
MPRKIEPIVEGGKQVRTGKGFSMNELRSANITASEARKFGIPVDIRRGTNHEDNVEILKEYILLAKETGIKYKAPKQTSKPHVGRANRGLTSAGKKIRNLSHKK